MSAKTKIKHWIILENTLCPLKSHTFLSKPAALSCKFLSMYDLIMDTGRERDKVLYWHCKVVDLNTIGHSIGPTILWQNIVDKPTKSKEIVFLLEVLALFFFLLFSGSIVKSDFEWVAWPLSIIPNISQIF